MRWAIALALGLALPEVAAAGALEDSLAKLTPEFRAHQVCILRGLQALRREPKVRGADRMKTSIFSPAVLDGKKLIAKGGAVRTAGHWYALSFACELTPDSMKATSFSFTLGKEIPPSDWERLGLWR